MRLKSHSKTAVHNVANRQMKHHGRAHIPSVDVMYLVVVRLSLACVLDTRRNPCKRYKFLSLRTHTREGFFIVFAEVVSVISTLSGGWMVIVHFC
jgi:hypothetical protein